MQPDVSIIDYGINNLKSVEKAFQKVGKNVGIINTPEEILAAKCLVLPGIGSFEDGMKGLHERQLIESIKKKVREGTPLLGICLGMQMLFSESEEFGLHKGLNFIPGRVVPFKDPENGSGYKVPHMGWNELISRNDWNHTLLQEIPQGSDVYFVHSFFPKVENKEHLIATTIHGGQEVCAVVKRDNITGCQFHPEKSGVLGLKMIAKYCQQNEI